jgi:hypothetical protein
MPQAKDGQCPSGYRDAGRYCAPMRDRGPSLANAPLNPYYRPDNQVYYRGVPDAATFAPRKYLFSSMNRRMCRQILLRLNAHAFCRVSARLHRPLRYSHSIRPSQNRSHQHRCRRLPQRNQIRSLNGAVRRRTPRRRCAATWDHRGCNGDAGLASGGGYGHVAALPAMKKMASPVRLLIACKPCFGQALAYVKKRSSFLDPN